MNDRREPSGTSKPSERLDERSDVEGAGSADAFPVVGIGGSAGALSAFQELFSLLPSDRDMAYVVVSHSDPKGPALLPEILGRCTSMKVREAKNGMRVEPNQVYIAPAGRHLTLEDGVFELEDPAHRGHPPLPIDIFFRSLANALQERAIGIVLSGTGTDGTVGLGAIRESSGLTLAQDPDTAEFRDMPASAAASGAVDLVLPVSEMPDAILSFVPEDRAARKPATEPDETAAADLEPILSIVAQQTGRDFSAYKRGTLQRRAERRMHLRQIDDMGRYAKYLEENPNEVEALWRDWLIGVSSFFRDPEAFASLEKALESLIDRKEPGSDLRIWVPGCASGEEAYSVASLVHDLLAKKRKRLDLRVFATDLDEAAIDIARAGRYPAGAVADVAPERVPQFLLEENQHYRIKKEIRDSIVFAPQDVLQDPPFTKMDLISCRNLLIYLLPEAQRRTLLLLHYSLKPGGLLFLGSSESVTGLSDLFEPVDSRAKIFRRKESRGHARIPTEWTSPGTLRVVGGSERGSARRRPIDFAELLRQQLVHHYAPPAVIVDARGRIEQIHGRTGAFLEPAPGHPDLNVLEMAREGLRAPLASALQAVLESEEASSIERNVRVRIDGDFVGVRLVVRRISDRRLDQPMVVISFETPVAEPSVGEIGRKPRSQAGEPSNEIAQLQEELHATRQDRQAAVEELQVTNEELASVNEEIQSVNEELQSANEELMTSREETQSLNEELQTVNAELNAKVSILEEAQDDLLNLVNVTRFAIVFLDERLRVKRFTPEAQKLFRLIDRDIGRPLADVTTNLVYPDLEADARRVLDTLVPEHREVQSNDSTWWTAQIRPYRTSRNAIEGVVLTFVNVTRIKESAAQAETESRTIEAILDTVREPLVVLDSTMHVVRANRSFFETFRIDREHVEGSLLYDLGSGQWNIPALRQLLERVLPNNESFDDYAVEHAFPEIGSRKMLLNARRLRRDGEPERILLAIEDVTDRAAQTSNVATNSGEG